MIRKYIDLLKMELILMVSTYSDKNSIFGYKLFHSSNNYLVFTRNRFKRKVVAIHDKNAVTVPGIKNGDSFRIYPNLDAPIFHRNIKINTNTLPRMINGSKVVQYMLLPYMREIRIGVFVKDVRLVLITDKAQMFHNKPSRRSDCDGETSNSDTFKFEESVIWDLPEKKYPSKNKNCDSTERYLPFLPDEAYLYYPMLNTDESFKDTYGNGGFPKTTYVKCDGKDVEVGRFYIPQRKSLSNPFFHIGGEEPCDKLALIGTYRPNNGGNGVRTCVFATGDGGRNWYCKYEFGDLGDYPFSQGSENWATAFGNKIKMSSSINKKGCAQIQVKKRKCVVPKDEDKEPEQKFNWSDSVHVCAITASDSNTVVETTVPHGLSTGNIIALCGKTDNEELRCLLNNEISPGSAGNGLLYKVDVIDDTSFRIYEFVASPDNPIACRHIHSINRIKDGWIIGTGEIYPNGWLLYFQMKEADTYAVRKAADDYKIYRLNSSDNSVQRTLGAILLDDKDSTLIFASDHDTLERSEISVPDGRTLKISRSSTGVFSGKLSDIDDRNKFEVLYEAQEPSFFFKAINNRLIFGGQRGELAVSCDNGATWETCHLNGTLFQYYGTSGRAVYIGEYIIVMK